MIHEKTLTLNTGRSVKVIAQKLQLRDKIKIEVEVLIKEPKEVSYHPPIGVTHPKYWKLKKLDPQKSNLLQIQYSGLSEKQMRKTVKELQKTILPIDLASQN
jgi:hypothetical protein